MSLWETLTQWHDSRPPATTFAEGQQALMVKLLARAGIASTAIILALLGLWVGGRHYGLWSAASETLILYATFGVAALYGALNIVVTVSFSIGGPVGRIDLEATRNGVKVGASKERTDEATITPNPAG